jgi:hypothetical protein
MNSVASLSGAVTANQLADAGHPESANKLMFLQWLRVQAPQTYNAAMKIALAKNGVTPPVATQLAGLGLTFDQEYNPNTPFAKRYDQGLGAVTLEQLYRDRPFSKRYDQGLGALSDYSSYTMPSSYTNDQIAAAGSTPVNLTNLPTSVPAITTDGTVSSSTPAAASTSSSSSTTSASSLASIFTTLTSVAGAVAKVVNPSSSNIVALNATRAAQGLPPLNSDGTVMTPAQLAAAGYTTAQIASMEAALAASGSTTMTILGLPWYLWALGAGALAVVLAKSSK